MVMVGAEKSRENEKVEEKNGKKVGREQLHIVNPDDVGTERSVAISITSSGCWDGASERPLCLLRFG